MQFLLDTNIWLRGALFDQTLPKNIASLLRDPDAILGLSIYSIWEAAKKHQKGKLPLPMDLAVWLNAAIPENVQILPLTTEIIIESSRLPEFPVNDPGDELIIATARIHKLTLLTTDTKLKNYRHAKVHYVKPLEPQK